MTLQDLQTMVDYHYWARDRMLDALELLAADEYNRNIGGSFSSIRETATHIYAAEWAWYQRWRGESPTALLTGARFPELADLRRAWTELEAQVRAFVDGLGDGGVSRIVEYKLLSGHAGASPMWQMVQHVVNHASYHRGQITTMLRQIGAQPPKPLDMIAYYRIQSAGAR